MSFPDVVLQVAGLLALAVLLSLVARRVHLPLTVVLVVVALAGSALGVAPEFARLDGEAFETLVVTGFLPALVFAAALDLDLRAFLRNLGAIVALAVLGFVISAALVGLALHAVLGITLVVALLFGALISATDPVAVVAIFRELGVPRRLLVLVEGESLLNDGVAIVLSAILLEASLGGSIDLAGGLVDFVAVFGGGALIGAAIGLAAAAMLPWLSSLPGVALSIAVAYGGFVLAEEVLGFSGVMATAVAGMMLSGLAPSRASAELREAWEQTWGALDYVANALLFLLIGLAVQPMSLLDEGGPILLALGAVLLARAAAVVPLVWLLERTARIRRVGKRNEAVLIWGGLRGGVALALALALPEELAEREVLVSLTGGVVLGTLILNATTIRWLVHRLGLDTPSQVDQFTAQTAKLAGVRAAQDYVSALGLSDAPHLRQRLAMAEDDAVGALEGLDLDPEHEMRAVLSRALHAERTTYQELSDEGLLPPAATRVLLHQVDDEVEDLAAGIDPADRAQRRQPSRADRMSQRLLGWLPKPPGESPLDLEQAEASARRLAAHRTREALSTFEGLPAVTPQTLSSVRQSLQEWENHAVRRLEEVGADPARRHELHERQATLLAQAATKRQLRAMAEDGLLPARLIDGTDILPLTRTDDLRPPTRQR